MMEVSFSRLEQARLDPKLFAKALVDKTPDQKYFGKYSKHRTWIDAVLRYHKYGGGSKAANRAADYFEDKFKRYADNAATRREKIKMLLQLDGYIKAFDKMNWNFLESRRMVELVYDANLSFRGQMQYLFMTDQGRFGAVSIAKERTEWRSELRYPLIQSVIANQVYNGDVTGVDLGMYYPKEDSFDVHSFDQREIDAAKSEFDQLSSVISKVISKSL